MSIQENLQAVSKYDWSGVNAETASGFIQTVHKETNRKPDEYYFWADEIGLIDPATGRYLYNIFTPDSHRNHYLGQIESDIVKKLDKWETSNEDGFAIWISPDMDGEYPANKIILHQIAYAFGSIKKASVNNVLLFDGPPEICLQIAKTAFPEMENLDDLEELRKTVITRGKDLDVANLIETVSKFIPQNPNYKKMAKEDLLYLSDLAVRGKDPYYIAREMYRLGVLGEHLMSCPTGGQTLLDLMLDNSSITHIGEGWHGGTCKVCKAATWVGPCNICKPCERKF